MSGSRWRVCDLVGGACVACALVAGPACAAEVPARQVQDAVPQGRVTAGVFASSAIFPGTQRD